MFKNFGRENLFRSRTCSSPHHLACDLQVMWAIGPRMPRYPNSRGLQRNSFKSSSSTRRITCTVIAIIYHTIIPNDHASANNGVIAYIQPLWNAFSVHFLQNVQCSIGIVLVPLLCDIAKVEGNY